MKLFTCKVCLSIATAAANIFVCHMHLLQEYICVLWRPWRAQQGNLKSCCLKSTENDSGAHAQPSTGKKLPVGFFKLFRGRAGVGRGVFMGSLGPSWQSAPLKPGQHFHSSCVTILYLVTYLGLKFTRYLCKKRVAPLFTGCCQYLWPSQILMKRI